ncbi:mastermind-like protein 3 isoform X1 [Polyodon spathula]|uniref:mastermind-like protein 3 isoform X1 n=1 Tax=Polyodon spathula TaxID=7913 RepID=UPI001B7DF557|nr:mastermind-like protein 3 isoform X1 [Polyodon spathula]
MGDFAAPTAANGSSICINNNTINSGINTNNNSNNVSIPKHSTVVERLRQRIEGCRRHHVNCENRYQQAQVEQLEIERRETVSLYQRSLEQRAKKSANNKQQNKQQDPESAATAEQRNNTLIALQETVKRKLDSARSPLNGEQNGICDGNFSPNTKRLRKEGPGSGMDSLAGLPNSLPPVPSVSPLHQMDIKPTLPIQNSGGGNNHVPGRPDDLGKNGGLTDIKLQVNGTLDLDDGFNLLQSKDMKQEPLDDTTGIESSDTSLSNHNKLFSDINLNDQEWQELIDELANTVPEDDMHDLFNEDFEEKKEAEFTRPAAQTPLPQEPPPPIPPPPPQNIKNDPARSPFSMPIGSPQVRPSSSGPQFTTASNSTPPHQQPPPASMAVGSPANCVARSPQTPNQATRPGNGFLMNQGPGVVTGPSSSAVAAAASGQGGGPVPSTPDLSPAEQLKQMAAQQQQRAKLIQQKQHQQQQQQQQQTPAPNWSPVGPPTSPYGGAFNPDKPNSPMMYPQAFNNQNPMVPPMVSNPQKATMNNYLPQSHMNMINQQPNSMGQNTMSKQQAAMLSYSNTKPLTHFSAVDHMGQRMTPPMANPNKNPMMPYMQQQQAVQQQQQQQQQQVPPQAQIQMSTPASHLSEEQKRILLLKHKGLLNQSMSYSAMQPHNQEQNVVGISRQAGCVQPSLPGPGSVAPVPSTNPGAPGYLGNQQQAAMMKQMIMEQEKQRVQLHLMEQQKQQQQQQLLREQRQQQQHQMLAEQQLQQQHLPRQLPQQQRNPYPVQQVNQFQGTPQEIARNQVLQNIRTARMLQQQQQQQQQSQGMLQMASVHNSGTMSTVAGQAEMSMAYSNAPSGQQGMYGINPAMNQMLQHPNQSSMNMAHNPSQGQRQPSAGQGVGMVGGYGQGMLINSAMSQQQQQQQQQQMKGPPVGQAIPKVQAQRLQMMGGAVQGAQGWQQQGMPGRTSGEMVTFNNSSAYAMQSSQPRVTKQHFPQGMSQSVVDPTGNIRTMNPAMGGQMMPHMSGQPRTNQPRPMVMAGMSQGVPNMNVFSQGPGQQMGGGSYLQSGQPQGYQRTVSQDLSFSYGQSAGGGSFSSLADGADLVDSLMKGGSTDEWIDEILGNQ